MPHDDGVSPYFKELTRLEQRADLLRRFRETKAEIALLIQDIESWNNNNRWGESMDVGLPELYERNAEIDRMIMKLNSAG